MSTGEHTEATAATVPSASVSPASVSPATVSPASVSPASRVRRGALRVLALALACLVLAAVGFHLRGGRFFVVRTPSMGTAAPVGSLVLTRPAPLSSLRVGDVISYHPPGEPGETYTHRVVALAAHGVRTRGDINGATDPWIVGAHDIVGRAVAIPALGWLVRALPLLLVGGLLIWGVTALWVSPARRGPLRMSGSSLLFAISAVLLKPFVNVVQLESSSSSHGAFVRTVSTGLLPIRLNATGGQAAPVDLSGAGAVGTSHFTGGGPGTKYLLQASLHLTPLQWALAALVCASPLLWTLVVGYRPEPVPSTARHRASGPSAA